MSAGKWHVGKEDCPGGLWEVRSPYGFLEGLAHTHAEAIDFADREARWERDLERLAPGSPIHAAVTEIVRLRRGMEELREKLIPGVVYTHEYVSDKITHILEGEQ